MFIPLQSLTASKNLAVLPSQLYTLVKVDISTESGVSGCGAFKSVEWLMWLWCFAKFQPLILSRWSLRCCFQVKAADEMVFSLWAWEDVLYKKIGSVLSIFVLSISHNALILQFSHCYHGTCNIYCRVVHIAIVNDLRRFVALYSLSHL